jgi:hypothetical protein
MRWTCALLRKRQQAEESKTHADIAAVDRGVGSASSLVRALQWRKKLLERVLLSCLVYRF